MSLSSTAQNAAVGSGATGSGPEPGRRFVVTVTLLTGVFMVAAGAWALLGPDSFADAVRFPRHVHLVHDAGAFQLGIGIILLLGATWRDGLALALAGLLVANTIHAVNHAVDLDLGGRPLDPWGLAALSLDRQDGALRADTSSPCQVSDRRWAPVLTPPDMSWDAYE
jgi:hypothetical protein